MGYVHSRCRLPDKDLGVLIGPKIFRISPFWEHTSLLPKPHTHKENIMRTEFVVGKHGSTMRLISLAHEIDVEPRASKLERKWQMSDTY